MEQKINRNYNLKWMVRNEMPATYSMGELGCTVHELKYEAPQGEYNVWIKTDINNVNWIVYEMMIPTAVQLAVRDFLSSHGLKWKKAIFLEAFTNNVSSAYDMLGQRVSYDTFHKGKPLPYRLQTASLKSEYKHITEHPFYALYKSDFDELAAEQYEDYYTHVMEEITNVQA